MIEMLEATPPGLPTDPGPYRLADWDALPESPRCELIFGRLYVSPSPTIVHQVSITAFWEVLEAFARERGGLAIVAPIDVVLADHSVVQPDLVYVGPERRDRASTRVNGAPDLAVEILSPGTARRDRGVKLKLFADHGVREYWIVDPDARQVEFLVARRGRFVVALPEGDVYRSEAIDGLSLDLRAVWEVVAERLGR